MNKFTSALALGLTLAASGPAFAVEFKTPQAQARSIIKDFAGDLKANLVSAMKDGGPINALQVCNSVAVPLATQASENSGWTVGRTSLKLRNQANAANAFEQKVMTDFEARKAAGADPQTLEHFEIVTLNGKKTFRYMKAIPTKAVCLKCHGSLQKQPLKNKLAELYPDDRATGYKAGQLRGAFTLSKVLK
ncbi:MAG: DUF3365 domain-containing protein [Hyphomicrobiaceae bacterium]|nr:DUF3365 domain-containing protein [Hyphomicrobiaceae bacterium]